MTTRMTKRKTALVLSGGGGRGAFEAGAWKALREKGIDFHMVTGTSVGAINGTMAALDDYETAEKMWLTLGTEDLFDIDPTDNLLPNSFDMSLKGLPLSQGIEFVKNIIKKGGATSSGILTLLKSEIDEEYFRNHALPFGIVVSEFPSLKGHYLWTEDIPQGRFHDFVHASASCFPLSHKKEIDGKSYIDGGYNDNLPIAMTIQRGANDIYAIYLDAPGSLDKKNIKKARSEANLKIISTNHDLGSFLHFSPDVSIRNLKLGYRAGRRAIGAETGVDYSFEPGAFSKAMLPAVDAAAFVFGLDPLTVYSKSKVNEVLKPSILTAQLNLTRNPIKNRSLTQLKNKIDGKVLAVYFAREYENKGNERIFTDKIIKKAFNKELHAAKYIKNLLI